MKTNLSASGVGAIQSPLELTTPTAEAARAAVTEASRAKKTAVQREKSSSKLGALRRMELTPSGPARVISQMARHVSAGG